MARIPVYISSNQVSEIELAGKTDQQIVEEIKQIAREHGLARFVVYKVTSAGRVPLAPTNVKEQLIDAKSIEIVRKDIAGSDIFEKLVSMERDVDAEIERLQRELEALKKLKEAIEAAKALVSPAGSSSLGEGAEAETEAEEAAEEPEAGVEGWLEPEEEELPVWEA